MASAATNEVTADCTQNCTGTWLSTASVSVQFSWTGQDTGLGETLSPDCNGGDWKVVSAEGDTTLDCKVTYPDSSVAEKVVHVLIDRTAPVPAAAGSSTVQPNAAGWFSGPFDVLWQWTDSLSGVTADTCDLDSPYSGGDTLGFTMPIECRDRAGNLAVAPTGFPIKFDATAPDDVDGTADRAPDDSGWYTHSVAYSFHGTDPAPGSGLKSCDGPLAYSGPDSANASITGGCVDVAGNRTNATDTFKFDATKPTVTGATGTRAPDHNGWYTSPVTFSFAGTDAMSGIDVCDDPTYTGPDSATASVTGACADVAGNVSALATHNLQYDTTSPTVTGALTSRAPDHNGWYTHPVSIVFQGTDATSGIDSCDGASYGGPDAKTTEVTGACTDKAGNVSDLEGYDLKYDATKPTMTTASADRAPDRNGWYTHPISFSFDATDATSGVADCTQPSYSGPDSGAAQVTGSCVDGAGNVVTRTVSFKYDDSAPAASKPFAVPGNRSAAVSWSPPADADSFILTRSLASGGAATTVYRGSAHDYVDQGLTNGTRYTYTVTTLDAAGNQSAPASISTVADGSTLRPFIDTEVFQAPSLTWAKKSKASYYNVQIYLGKSKVLSIWPKTTSLKLRSKWRFNRHSYSLKPGLYRWYVWPGVGRMAAHKYGALVGSSTFRVVT
jgi:hypothetical protein